MSRDGGALNLAWSQQLIAGFAAAGVRQAVISPGSRSTPLALALLREPRIHCRVIVDERSAAFFALGLAKAGRQPVIVVATSGSAPANWLPAIVEASRSAHPLIFIAADRPPELQRCGANQTLDQVDLFASQVRARHALSAPDEGFDPTWLHRLAAQAVDEACWPLPGPIHLNQPFREPLLPAAPVAPPAMLPPVAVAHGSMLPAPALVADVAARLAGRPGAILCGEMPAAPGFAAAVTGLARQLDCPILAEPLSGLRFGAHDRSRVCCRYEGWLRHPAFVANHRPAWLLRLGAFPVTRALQEFAAAGTAQVLVDPLPRWNDPANALAQLVRADPTAFCQALAEAAPQPAPAAWWAAFARAEAAASDALPAAIGESSLLPAILAALPAACPVFVGNSMLIRDIDAFSGSGPLALEFFANRGVSGIDGNISTALGIAAARGRVVALVGDLTCQHDLGGLAAAAGLDAVIVVFNNGGGGIFEYLPQAALPEFEQGWLTPQAMDFAAAARAFNLRYQAATAPAEAAAAVRTALTAGGPALVEIRIDRSGSVAERRAWLEAVARLDLAA